MCICHSENHVHWDSFITLFEKLVMLPSSAAGDRAKHLLVNYLGPIPLIFTYSHMAHIFLCALQNE